MTELFRFEYDDGEGLEVISTTEGEILTYVEVTEKFLQFLKATGYDYLGAYRDEDGNIVIDHSGEVDLSRTVFTSDELEDYAEIADGWKSPEDYWDTVVDESAAELELPVVKPGDVVEHTGKGTPDDVNGGHRGFRGDSLIGKFGVVTKVEGPVASVEWDDWEDGNGHYRDQWNVFIDNLKVIG